MVSWIEVVIAVPVGTEELAAESFCQPPFTGMSVEPGRVITYTSTANDSPAEREDLRASLIERGALAVEFRSIPDQDFASLWEASWHAFRVGRICIVPRSTDSASLSLRSNDIPLRLDPGGAFGTGTHGSTRGSLALMQHFVTAGDRVLDAGSGSGILSVAAALLGASEVLGFDVDPNGRPHGEELAVDNRVADRCRFLEGGFDELPAETVGYDGVLANIYLDILLGYARTLRELLRPNGWFVMSGIRFTERDRILAHVRQVGFEVERETRRGKWLTIAGRRVDAARPGS